MLGQALGLPASMTLYSFIGVAVTSASVVLFGKAIWDPVELLGKFNQPVVAGIALLALLIATLNTNVAANVVSPSNDFSNLAPSLRLSREARNNKGDPARRQPPQNP